MNLGAFAINENKVDIIIVCRDKSNHVISIDKKIGDRRKYKSTWP
jgi:hypothetical protein